MRTLKMAAVLLSLWAGVASQAQAPGPVALTPDEMTFSTEGLALPGMDQVNLVGDPNKPGPYTVRLRCRRAASTPSPPTCRISS